MSSLGPQNYKEWRDCIEVKCGIKITAQFCEERLSELKAVNNYQTQKFIQLYGSKYHATVIEWFNTASKQLSEK